MKKILLALLCAVCISYASVAQSVSVGPRVGVNFATQKSTGDDAANEYNDAVESATGLQAGAVLNFAINDMFSIQPELLYSQKGFKIENAGAKGAFKANYLDVPVLAKISFGPEAFKGFVTAGPTVSYWMSGKSKYEFEGETEDEDYNFDDTDNCLDLGASFGVGLGYGVGPGMLNLDVRYGFGLSSVYDGGGDDIDAKVRNRVLGVSLAYLFGAK